MTCAYRLQKYVAHVTNNHSRIYSKYTINLKFHIIIQVALLATLALLLAAIGGSDMSLRYIFVIHVYLGMHQSEVYEVWIVRVVEAGSNIVYVAMTQVYSRAIMQ